MVRVQNYFVGPEDTEMRPKRAALTAGIVGFIFVCSLTTLLIGILGSFREFIPCRCRVESVATRYIYNFLPDFTQCLSDTVSICLCEGRRSPESVTMESPCGMSQIVVNTTKEAFYFKSIIYSGYTLDYNPPMRFTNLFVGFIILGISLIAISLVVICLIAKYDRDRAKERGEEEMIEEGEEERIEEGEEEVQAA